MVNSELLNILGFTGMGIIIVLATILAWKLQRFSQLQSSFNKLKRSVDEMDEQAKLIVRTDMELNKTQEELDKKVTGLYALQRLSRAISTTLEENQIFKRIDPEYLRDIGFEKCLAFSWNERDKKFMLHLNIGYENEDAAIKNYVNANPELYLNLIKNEKTFSSISADKTTKAKLDQTYRTVSFVISPILPKEGYKGFLFVGTENPDTLITEGDEELITILTNQLGQALENARLFEETWRARQDLGIKVEERTRELTLALEELNKISKRKTDFISSVSHELRTPLTSIKGYASILATGKLGDLPEPARERVEKINRHSDELVHLVNDLLDISRIEAGKTVMKQETHQIKDIAEQAVDLLAGQLKEKQIELGLDIQENANSAFVDRGQIERVFINLIGNAIKFTPQEGKIYIRSYKVENAIQVDVTDTGCGIPPEAQDAIFNEFYRVDNLINQEVKGTGLGLTLVKHIIEAHGGKIWVKSKVGSGSTFSFMLPV